MRGMIQKFPSDETLSRKQDFEWYRRFGEGRENVDDDERSGSPRTSRTAENIEKFSAAGLKTYNDGVKMKATILQHPLYSGGWADFSRVRATSNIFQVLRSI
ncbi:hypothetical protein TNCV_4767651 [Trichonephila clavipes]|nr:hypothetical protein TNCV_4767651 [Trichonephila clavipes]